MTDLEIKSIYQSNYLYLLTLLETYKSDSAEYKACAKMVEKYREYVKRLAQLDDLPEVPKL